ncbi:transmembrane protein, putative (macronuclear) [Tetrahymena thermophila SB210]|uniref:Transmembrane protein, putative n=1 Tax=Tetrahymena thermophila (strain SB210) TaxID=312017 RepID=Q22DH8_TETTS|nr:transmembrane protein, putative [Tetrahymena thermophila SB210]EAR83380.1 transmembrane protein, putative [Tetrahymena thermophila SB210]|eukprot:XP_001031043.1 transmembrane protein, putative [Tetrahymena thermophila SB210]
MSDYDRTRENSVHGDKEIQLQTLQKKYEQMAVDHEQAEEREQQHEQNIENEANLMPIPIKIIGICLILLFSGVVLFTIGLVDILQEESKTGRDVSLLIIGVILLIPGLYYTFQLISACFARTRSERQQILNEFPIDYMND